MDPEEERKEEEKIMKNETEAAKRRETEARKKARGKLKTYKEGRKAARRRDG
jgi:hypothetical protein